MLALSAARGLSRSCGEGREGGRGEWLERKDGEKSRPTHIACTLTLTTGRVDRGAQTPMPRETSSRAPLQSTHHAPPPLPSLHTRQASYLHEAENVKVRHDADFFFFFLLYSRCCSVTVPSGTSAVVQSERERWRRRHGDDDRRTTNQNCVHRRRGRCSSE